ncbi:UBA/THIF-type NAD/FAD binding fold familiy [Paraglaciecola sp. T6c]|uniref:HesA/MoeB/ThiF family protein n=1 Tax=Pseudoalteromonas atlantica (strain T6c / ATCC BAA-1087) TaxID=3042615 RepID=UPI00005C5E7A|nr:HesA/MoeB/ThiF family protein [Paraglaciecola sp. T6c]ABG40454.1 UBA/THIF-type NAD/FAD binding fold familiy [Paraglaciecola sp. T6c]
MSLFSAGEWQQYQRHIQLDAVGVDGQFRLKNAKVLVVGAGGLGCPVAMYLGAAGVGNITIIDGDSISQTNLHRQVLFAYTDVGKPKAHVAAIRIRENNPFITVAALDELLSESNIDILVAQADIVLDCTDNFATRLQINDTCRAHDKPWVYASVLGLEGQVALFTPSCACFRCIFPDIPADVADCNSAGVLGSVVGAVGLLQANTCLGYLLDLQDESQGKLHFFSGISNQVRSIALQQNKLCTCASPSQVLRCQPLKTADPIESKELGQEPGLHITDDIQSQIRSQIELSPEQFVKQLGRLEGAPESCLNSARKSKVIDIGLIDVRSADEHRGFNIGGQCLPLSDDFADRVGTKLSHKTQPILLYCQSGKRSYKAALRLRAKGYGRVYSLKGGLGELLSHSQFVKWF